MLPSTLPGPEEGLEAHLLSGWEELVRALGQQKLGAHSSTVRRELGEQIGGWGRPWKLEGQKKDCNI